MIDFIFVLHAIILFSSCNNNEAPTYFFSEREGFVKVYYQDSSIYKTYRWDEKANIYGERYTYNRDGSIYSIENFDFGELERELICYDHDSNRAVYQAYNYDGEVFIKIHYLNDTIRLINPGSCVIGDRRFSLNAPNKDSLIFDAIIASPPNAKVNVQLKHIIRKSEIYYSGKKEHNYFSEIRHAFPRKLMSDSKIFLYVIMEDTVSKRILRDTVAVKPDTSYFR